MTKKVKLLSISVLSSKKYIEPPPETPADFETAIEATGLGKYNLLLILLGLPAGWATVLASTTMSYVSPAAQCDLDLSLEDKGLLNAATDLGEISSGIIWGFLYSVFGRRKLLMVGFGLNAVFVLMGALSQTKELLMAMKVMEGFIINGPYAAFVCYLSEFQSAQYRSRMQLGFGFFIHSGLIFLPLLALGIMPLELELKLASLKLHSWNVYLLICSLPSIVSAVAFSFMPESPKFLMAIGRNDKALTVFQRVYSINTGNAPNTFPIKELVDETKNAPDTANKTKVQALKQGWIQIKPLFSQPHLVNLILVCALQMLLSFNTLRLWLPQFFQVTNEYQRLNNGTSASLCTMLKMNPVNSSTGHCVVHYDTFVYINSMVVSGVTMVSCICASFFINAVGKKALMNILGIISGTSAMTIYFSTSTAFTVTFSSIFLATASVSSYVNTSVMIDLFPTTLRSTAISISTMMSMTASMTGNALFPILLKSECASPFFSTGSIFLGFAFLALLLPNTDMKALQ